MKKVLVWSLILLIFSANFVYAKKQKEEVTSTEGVELDATITKTLKQKSKEEAKAYKLQNKAKNKYIKNISKIKKLNNNKRLKERDLEFLNSRLHIKQQQLEELKVETEETKGEEE